MSTSSKNILTNDGHCPDPTARVALRNLKASEKRKVKIYKRAIKNMLRADGLVIKGDFVIVSKITGMRYF